VKLTDIVKRAFAKADDRIQAAFETPEETNARRAGVPTYSRHVPNPAWGDKRPESGDRVVGRQVVSEGPRPFGEVVSVGAWAGDFGREYAAAESESSAIGADFFAARQALADRKR
jgi:hypothetical protein